MHPCSFCAGMRRPMRAGRFLDMPEVLPQRGAASGGQRRSLGAAESMASPQAASCAALGHHRPAARARVLLDAGLRRVLVGGRARCDARAHVREMRRRGGAGRICGGICVCVRTEWRGTRMERTMRGVVA